MDAVIAYVNGCEKVWRTEYNKYCSFNPAYYFWFYDWGTLKYVLRGISIYMPYIKNVFLIVSNIEQVPDYVDQSKVKIVLHKDFISEEYLPTFQPNTIELYMHRIPGLDEEFVYFNDDMIPMNPIAYSDLVYMGKPCMSFMENYSEKSNMAYNIIRNSFIRACKYVYDKNSYSKDIIDNPISYNGPGVSHMHSPCVFLRSKNEDIFNHLYYSIKNTISIERNNNNVSQNLYSDVLYLENNYIGSRLTLTYLKTTDIKENIDITSINTNYLCLNDFGPIDGFTYKESADLIKGVLENKFYKKCKYEPDCY